MADEDRLDDAQHAVFAALSASLADDEHCNIATVPVPDALVDRELDLPMPVGYAALAHACPAPADEHAAALAVMGPLLTAGLLHPEIREAGGAYGTAANYDLSTGAFTMFSFRDPAPRATLAVFERAPEWLAAHLHRDDLLDQAKLAAIRELERTESPAVDALRDFEQRVLGVNGRDLARFTQRVLALDAQALGNAFEACLLPASKRWAVMAEERGRPRFETGG